MRKLTMKINRRATLSGLFAATILSAGFNVGASAQEWKTKYPELVLVGGAAENASGITTRYQPLADYLAKELGVKVTLRLVNDYAAIIEGQRTGAIHIAYHGPSSYVRAYNVTNGGIEPFVTSINQDGSIGYYSVAYVRADDAATKLEDLKGKNLGLVDPNSTSGNNVPRFAMDKAGIEPEKFFSKIAYTGSHENALLALKQGTVDVAFNWWNSNEDSNLTRMAKKGMVSEKDFKIIFRSDLIAGAPVAYISSMPSELKAAIRQAFLDLPKKDPETFSKLSDGKDKGLHPVTHADYKSAMELQTFVDALRKKGS